MSKRRGLIVDVGMHRGRDTEFYLKKGFDVVAIEANPDLAKQGRLKFSEFIAAGRLSILNVAIADFEGTIDFFAFDEHDDWGTVSEEFRMRNEALGIGVRSLKVPAAQFENLIADFPTPYYVKIDIEGADFTCLSSFGRLAEKPKYVSIEPSLTSKRQATREFELLRSLGYTKFKIVNQALHSSINLPNPPREGIYTDFRFDGYSTGPFGEECPGEWVSYGKAFKRYRRLLLEQRFFGAGAPLYGTRLQRLYERLVGEPVGWYDVHAAR